MLFSHGVRGHPVLDQFTQNGPLAEEMWLGRRSSRERVLKQAAYTLR